MLFFGLEEAGTFGKKFEVIKVFGRGRTYDLDISIPRADNKTGKGSKGFEITSHPEFSIREAAKRRDLAINSMAYDPLEKVVYDPYRGYNDIVSGVIRVTDEKTFPEDPVRVVRLMQFLGRFGGVADPETVKLCRQMVAGGELDGEARNRIFDEFGKLFVKGVRPSLGLRFALEIGLFERYFPQLFKMSEIPQDPNWHPEGSVWEHTMQVVDCAAEIAMREGLNNEERLVLMLAAFGHDFGKISHTQVDGLVVKSHGHEAASEIFIEEFMKWFCPEGQSNTNLATRKAVIALAVNHMKPVEYYLNEAESGKEMTRAVGRLAKKLSGAGTSIRLLCLLSEADQRGRGERGEHLSLAETFVDYRNTWLMDRARRIDSVETLPACFVSGADLMTELGLEEGVLIGILRGLVYEDQLAGEIEGGEAGIVRARFYMDRIEMLFRDVQMKELKRMENLRELLVSG